MSGVINVKADVTNNCQSSSSVTVAVLNYFFFTVWNDNSRSCCCNVEITIISSFSIWYHDKQLWYIESVMILSSFC
jgi:hypothetical protein